MIKQKEFAKRRLQLMGIAGDGLLNNPYWGTWIWDSTTSKRTYELVKRYTHRPAEQLYRLSSDKYEMENLVDEPEHALLKQELSSRLDQWMQAQGDPGVEQDTPESHKAAKQGNHRFVPPDDQ